MARTTDMTEGRCSSLILKFFFPLLCTNMLQQAYSLADTAIVGKGLGDNALAAVGNMSSLTFFIMGFSMGLSNGFGVSVAQSYGAKDSVKLKKTVASALKLSFIIAVILTAISVTALERVLILMQTDRAIIADSLTYGYIIFGGLIATIAYNICACILRALGDSKTAFTAIVASSVINISLNWLLIMVFKTGVGGAAAATVISQLFSAAICFNKIRKLDFLKLTKDDFKADLRLYGELFGNGIPMALMNSVTAVGCVAVQYFVNGMGVACTSAYSVCSKYINLFMSPAVNAGFAMSAFTGQNYGAGKYSRIKEGLKTCIAITLVTYVITGSAMIFLPETLARVMLTGSEPVGLAVRFLPLCGAMMFTVDVMFVLRNGCQAMGKPVIPMISGIVEMFIRIAAIVLLSGRIGFTATAYAEILAWTGALLINGPAFFIYLSRACRSAGAKKQEITVQGA